ncbi:MAG: hypothetical protein HPY45_13085 [Anaerolineae bacterium]|nr:hypothetical protein [Anaerolineae bacterium]
MRELETRILRELRKMRPQIEAELVQRNDGFAEFRVDCFFMKDDVLHSERIGFLYLWFDKGKLHFEMQDNSIRKVREAPIGIEDIYKRLTAVPGLLEQTTRQGGCTQKTEMRFEQFERIRAENPTFTMEQVSARYNELFAEDCFTTGDTVRNTYRLMNVRWKKSKKR